MSKWSECCDSIRAIGVRLVTHDTGSCRDALFNHTLRLECLIQQMRLSVVVVAQGDVPYVCDDTGLCPDVLF